MKLVDIGLVYFKKREMRNAVGWYWRGWFWLDCWDDDNHRNNKYNECIHEHRYRVHGITP